MFLCSYVRGPLDGEIEVRHLAPKDGEQVHRLVNNRYVTYQWSASKFGFVHLPPMQRKAVDAAAAAPN
ncbi:MAG: hypothetical protein KDA45_15245 [Planctomycetales bacterium]|nr:hypothetical protein [Planctomycetales bacterium]